jgi:hypothetical protein
MNFTFALAFKEGKTPSGVDLWTALNSCLRL